MSVKIKDPDDNFSEFLRNILNSKEVENLVTDTHDKTSDQDKKESVDAFKIRQLEQKQELLVGLTNLLFKKFEEIHPSKKYSKFEFTDLSWYKKLGTS